MYRMRKGNFRKSSYLPQLWNPDHCKRKYYPPRKVEAQVKPIKEKKKGSCLKTILIVFAAIIALGIIASALGDEDSKEEAQPAQKEAVANTAESKEPEVPEEPSNIFYVGDVVEAKDCKISYLSAKEYETGNDFLQPKDGYIYYQMEFEFENTDDSDLALSSMLEWTCYADDYKVDQAWIGDENGLDGSVSPGKKAKGAIYFEVPADAESIELQYETNFWSEDKIIFIVK